MDPSIGIDRGGRVIGFSAEGALGWSAIDVLDRPWLDLVPAPLRADAAHRLAGILGGASPDVVRTERLRRDGSVFPCFSVVSPVRDARGAVVGVVEVLSAEGSAGEPIAERSRELLAIANGLPQLVWTATADGVGEWASARYLEFTGRPMEDVTGEGWIGDIHPDDRPALAERWREALATGAPLLTEARLQRADGAYRWFDVRAVPLRGDDGAILRWFGANTDVTEAHEAQRALVQEKQLLNALASTVPGALHTLRIEAGGRIWFPWASPAIVDIFGVDADTLRADARPALRRIHPDEPQSAPTLDGPWAGEFRAFHPTKGEIWVEARATSVRDAAGTTWHGLLTDTTERRRADDELRTSRARLLSALAAGDMGTWTVDAAARLAWFDARAGAMIGLGSMDPPVDLEALAARVGAEDRETVRRTVLGMAAAGGRVELEILLPGGDALARWIAIRGGREAGETARWSGVCVDITATRAAAESRARMHRLEALGTLAAGIANDFNNLVYAITGNARLAAADLPADHPAQAALREVTRASTRAADLVRRILAFGGPDDERRREPCALGPIVQDAVQALSATLPPEVRARLRADPTTPAVGIDRAALQQLVGALLANAVHAVGRGPGAVDVELDPVSVDSALARANPGLREGRAARLTVRDDGAGMDEDTLARVFDPFFSTRAAGEGLGLSVVHGVARQHGGAVTVESRLGHGTTLRVYLPESPTVTVTPQSLPREAAPGAGLHVLYVDDERALVSLATRILGRQGYRVTGATSPADALQAFRADPDGIDLVVTDLTMPGMSGLDLAEALLAIRPELPILVTSGYVRPDVRASALALGVRDLVLKPHTLERLTELLTELARGLPRH